MRRLGVNLHEKYIYKFKTRKKAWLSITFHRKDISCVEMVKIVILSEYVMFCQCMVAN